MTPPSGPSADALPSGRLSLARLGWMGPVLAGLVTFFVFLPSLRNGFVGWDDDGTFLQNQGYRGLGLENLRWMFTSFLGGHYQPLSWLTLGFDYVVWGMNPLGYHLGNVLLHAGAAAVFASLAVRVLEERHLLAAPFVGVAVTLLWSLHPLRVEAVTWATERREVLCALLTLLAVSCHVRGRPKWQTAVLAACAMLAKATAVTIPVIVVLIDLYRAGPPPDGRFVRAAFRAVLRHADLVVLAAITSVVAVIAQRDARAMVSFDSLPFARRLVLYCYGAFFSLSKTAWPSGLAPLHQGNVGASWEFHPFVWWGAAVGAGLLVASVAIGWARRRRGLGWLALALMFVVMIAPAGGLGQSGPQTAAERYTYQPALVLALVIGIAWAALRDRLRLRAPSWAEAVVIVSLLAVLSFLTLTQQAVWHDTESLWLRQVSVYPLSPVGNYNLGYFYAGRQPPDLALSERYLRTSIAVAPGYPEPRCTLAGLLFSFGHADEALEMLDAALRAKPDHLPALFISSKILWDVGRTDEAIAALQKLAAADPKNPESYRQLARAQAAASRPQDAIATFERGMERAPHRELAGDYAWLLATHPDPSVRNGRRAVEITRQSPTGGSPDVREVVRLAAAYAEAGEFEQAIREVREAARTLPPATGEKLAHLIDDLERREPIRAEPKYP